MRKHILQLNFPDTTNEGILLIDDISIYDPNLINTSSTSATSIGTIPNQIPCDKFQVSCSNIQITSPGFYTPTSIDIRYGNSRLILNSCMLGISPPLDCGTSCPALPDGMYNIRYSVAPNDQVFVEYKILRIVQALNRYYNLLCRIGLTPCLPSQETDYQIRSLETIYNYLIAAKATVENEHQFTDGMNLYRFAIGLMDKMSFEPNRC